MMIAAEKEDVAEESIKNTLFLPTSVDLTFPAKWSRMSSPMTEVGLRWKSSKRQESIELILLTYSHLLSSTPTHIPSKSGKRLRSFTHANIIFITSIIILIVILLLATSAAVLTLIGNLK